MAESLYIHIPFCKRRCFYCDFAIATVGGDLQKQYVDTLCTEIHLTAKHFPPTRPLQTIFFGGGTPSLLPVDLLAKIFQTIHEEFSTAPHVEISLEANPDSLELEQLYIYKELGINRISLGVQTFQSELLKICGRDHTVEQIYEAVTAIKTAGFSNFSLDLISGLPSQTLKDWEFNLDQAIELQPTHLSIYDLILEENTAFYKQYNQNKFLLPSEESTVAMYLLTHEKLLSAGYVHYEISNYAQPNYPCKHNRNYWLNKTFYGVGMGATSYLNRQRIDRPRKFRAYLQMVEAWQANNILPTAPILSDREELFDTLMQGLRLAEGVNLAPYGQAVIADLRKLLLPYQAEGWLQWQGDNLSLTIPRGWLFSDQVISNLYEHLLEQQG
ncbi:MAG: radical SAM family heme chaperone HemW [Pseudanabaenaceae cyanobacterium]